MSVSSSLTDSIDATNASKLGALLLSSLSSRWSSNFDDECRFTFKSKSHFAQNAAKLQKFLTSGTLCDVTLKCGDVILPCHRLVLAVSSDYFAAMFTAGMSEARQSEISVSGIDPGALKLLVNFCYTGEISLTDSGVENLLSGACLLQLTEVIEACSDYLRHQLHPSNCLGIRNFADAQGCRRLHQSAHAFTTDHFMGVVQQTEFVLLPVDDLYQLLSSDELNVTCETVVFDALIRWLEHDVTNRKIYVSRLLPAVRLTYLSADFIVDNIENNELFRNDSSCKELITQAYKYHLLPNRRHGNAAECRPRKSTIGSLYVVGGNDSSKAIIKKPPKFQLAIIRQIHKIIQNDSHHWNQRKILYQTSILFLFFEHRPSLHPPIVDCDLSDDSFPFSTNRLTYIAGRECRMLRLSFVGELGFEVHTPYSSCLSVFNEISRQAKKFQAVNAGFRTIYSLSAEKGYRLWGTDLRNTDTPLESGLGFTCKLKGDTDFLGRAGLVRQKKEGVTKKLACFTLKEAAPLWGLELIVRNGKIVGYIRRAEFAYYLGKTIAYGYVEKKDPADKMTNEWLESGIYEIEAMGKRLPANLHLKHPFDPENKRLKGIYS